MVVGIRVEATATGVAGTDGCNSKGLGHSARQVVAMDLHLSTPSKNQINAEKHGEYSF